MSGNTGRSKFDNYMLGGGLEVIVQKGVAEAITKLKAAGLEPVNNGPVPDWPVQPSTETTHTRHHPHPCGRSNQMGLRDDDI